MSNLFARWQNDIVRELIEKSTMSLLLRLDVAFIAILILMYVIVSGSDGSVGRNVLSQINNSNE